MINKLWRYKVFLLGDICLVSRAGLRPAHYRFRLRRKPRPVTRDSRLGLVTKTNAKINETNQTEETEKVTGDECVASAGGKFSFLSKPQAKKLAVQSAARRKFELFSETEAKILAFSTPRRLKI